MYDFCPYCGRQLENGEKCSFCQPREPRNYEAPRESENYEAPKNEYRQNTASQYQQEISEFEKQHKARSEKKIVISFSVIGLFVGAQAMMACIGGFFALTFAGVSLTFSIIANKKNKKLATPIALPKVALVISIIAIVLDIVVGTILFILQWGDFAINFIS